MSPLCSQKKSLTKTKYVPSIATCHMSSSESLATADPVMETATSSEPLTATGQPIRVDKGKSGRFCIHNRRKYVCRECGSVSICEHNRVKSSCRECKGSQVVDCFLILD